MCKNKLLVVISGPTAVGKTDLAIKLAEKYNTEIISADSRQFYREISIGTAKPSIDELNRVKHHFINNLSITDEYNVGRYEIEVIELLENLFKTNEIVVMVGGSGLYIDAVCKGIDFFPDIPKKIRDQVNKEFADKGIIFLQETLKQLDPEYYNVVDKNNPKRLRRAIEVCIVTGKPYSEQRLNTEKERDFNILKIALNADRNILRQRIEDRAGKMISEGWIEEAESVIEHRNVNALNTVGYKELFQFLDGEIDLESAIFKIITNTSRYAKRQITWLKRDKEYHWFTKEQENEISQLIDAKAQEIS